MEISRIISELVQFNRTERPTFVKLYIRNADGDVLEAKRWPVENVFSHGNDCAEIIIEQSQMEELAL